MLLKEKLEKILNKKISRFLAKGESFSLNFTTEPIFGDFCSPHLMKIKKEKKEKLKEKIINFLEKEKNLKSYFEKIEYKEPGFINFFLSRKILFDKLKKIVNKKNPFRKKKEKIILEFISTNPTGPLTLGNARGGFLGDALANLLDKTGYNVFKEYYINDAKNSKQIQELGKTALGKSRSYLTPYVSSLIERIKKRNFRNESEAGFSLAKIIQKENQKFIEKKLKIKFDNWFSEESLYKNGEIEKTKNLLEKNNLTYKKEGAVFLKTKKFGDLEDRVIIRSNGQPTYFLSDIAYHLNKFKRGFDTAIDIWGADHQGHIKRMEAALKGLKILPKKKLKVIIVQMVSLKESGKIKKMSKRKGEYITLEELIDLVGLDVVKFFFLTKSSNTHFEFDLDLALEKSQKNPVYYLQYGWVRANSLFKKVGKPKKEFKNLNFLKKEEEIDLLREMIKFNQILEEISYDFSLQRLPHHLINLTKLFFNFYENCPISSSEKNLKEARLILTDGYKEILRQGLEILGISLPEKM